MWEGRALLFYTPKCGEKLRTELKFQLRMILIIRKRQSIWLGEPLFEAISIVLLRIVKPTGTQKLR